MDAQVARVWVSNRESVKSSRTGGRDQEMSERTKEFFKDAAPKKNICCDYTR
jgi:hypothetical protein